ncbi:hypothetical protein [Plasticicumulans sp.]|uniref:hypothetical protein n=1 Tax=Plasticicumulans sp. TaxID=2307179 RepID=UPI00322037EC
MTILESDIHLFQPQRPRDDTPAGGGSMTGTEVVAGAENELFLDLSEWDMAAGRVQCAKEFAIAVTPNTDRLLGTHVILSQPSADPNVSIALMKATRWADERGDVQAAGERYLSAGAQFPAHLLGPQVIGAQAITLWQRPSAVLPAAGTKLALTYHEGGVDEFQQVVTISKVSSSVQTLRTVDSGQNEFTVRVVILELVDELQMSFPGITITYAEPASEPTTIRSTQIAAAARFYACSPLALAAGLGARSIRVESIYTPIVPAATVEAAQVGIVAGSQRQQLVPAGPARRLVTGSAGSVVYCGRPLTPGTVTISGTLALTDTGAGTATGGSSSATIDYAAAIVRLPVSGVWNVDAVPAADVSGPAASLAIEVTAENRGAVWAIALPPEDSPVPGTIVLDYQVDGTWLALTDTGAGTLSPGDGGSGGGTVTYGTLPSVLATLAAQPDVGSKIVISYATPQEYLRRDDQATTISVRRPLDLGIGLELGSVAITWPGGGSTHTATVGSTGLIGGEATGVFDHATGTGEIVLGGAIDAGAALHVTGTRRSRVSSTVQVGASSPRLLTGTLSAAALPLRSMRIRFELPLTYAFGALATSVDASSDGSYRLIWAGVDVGSVDPSTGEWSVLLPASVAAVGWIPKGVSYAGDSRVRRAHYETVAAEPALSGAVTVQIDAVQNVTPVPVTLDVPLGALTVTLPAGGYETVPGGVMFASGGTRYWDRGGILYRDLAPATGAVTVAGAVNYATGVVSITSGTLTSVTLEALLVRRTPMPVSEIHGRVIGAPVKPGVTQVQATTLAGELIRETFSIGGSIRATLIEADIDNAAGYYALRFGRRVPVASLTPEQLTADWYDPDDVVDGHAWVPVLVAPASVTLTTVTYTTAALVDAEVGWSAARMPPDGRVPWVRRSDKVVVHHRQAQTVTSAAPSATVDLGRERVARVWVLDATGARVPSDRYTLDRSAGVLAWAAPLDLAGYPAPYTVWHTIEDLVPVLRADVTGDLLLGRALSHDFPLGSLVSSALFAGDLWARVEHLFSQASWTAGQWADAPVGDPTAWQFDDVSAPVVVTNAGAITERWLIMWLTTTTFQLVGEDRGIVAVGSKNEVFAPLNPATGVPYFTIQPAAWGVGTISAGNVLRLNTQAAGFPFWVIRTTALGTPSVGVVGFEAMVRAGVDAA